MTPNTYTHLLALGGVIDLEDQLETRIENNVSGQAIYVGKNLTPNALTSDPSWAIIKIIYDGSGFLIRTQLPDNGQGYLYVWDNRATYFS